MKRGTGQGARRGHGGARNRGQLVPDTPHGVGDRDELRRFWPSRAQIRYRSRIVEALRSGEEVTDTAICRQLEMSRQTPWEWRQDSDLASRQVRNLAATNILSQF